MARRPLWRANQNLRERATQLRHAPTVAEAVLWSRLRARQLHSLKFRRQHPIGRFIADFYCAEHRLVIELDGPLHERQAERDAERTAWLEEHGYRVIRFRNADIMDDMEHVVREIANLCLTHP